MPAAPIVALCQRCGDGANHDVLRTVEQFEAAGGCARGRSALRQSHQGQGSDSKRYPTANLHHPYTVNAARAGVAKTNKVQLWGKSEGKRGPKLAGLNQLHDHFGILASVELWRESGKSAWIGRAAENATVKLVDQLRTG